jgi:hypothetical protein
MDNSATRILLKLKYLFHVSRLSRIDFRDTLGFVGVDSCPESLKAIEELDLAPGEIMVIDSLYESMRAVESKDVYLQTVLNNVKYLVK